MVLHPKLHRIGPGPPSCELVQNLTVYSTVLSGNAGTNMTIAAASIVGTDCHGNIGHDQQRTARTLVTKLLQPGYLRALHGTPYGD